MPEDDFHGQPEGLDWIHCLSVPRELTLDERDPSRILQWPVSEVDGLRRDAVEAEGGEMRVGGRRADVVVEKIAGDFALTLDGALSIRGSDGGITLAIDEATGLGRRERTIVGETLESLRVLVDGSVVEVFANGGRVTFTTRWFPTEDDLTVRLEGAHGPARAWAMAAANPCD